LKTKLTLKIAVALLLFATLGCPVATVFAQGTAFTYQGQLNDGGCPANGSYDLTFTLFNANTNGVAIAGPVTNSAVLVTNGLFTVTIDFGAGVFNGQTNWLQIGVETNGGGSFTTLTPLQELTPTPYAIYSANAGNAVTAATAATAGSATSATLATTATTANSFSGSLSGDVTGTQGATVVSTVGGVSAASVASAANAANAATTVNTANTIVARDASGNFSAGTITANSFSGSFTGNGAGLTNIPTTAVVVVAPHGMTFIPPGTFTMGGFSDNGDASPPTNVYVSAFFMDVNLVSYAQWLSVYYWATNHGYGFDNAGSGKAVNHPVQMVDWCDCVKWCNARSQQAGLTPVYYTDANLTQVYTNRDVTPYVNWTANGYQLPTEAEWEKAARGGLSGQLFPWGNTISESLANYCGATSLGYDLGPNGYNTNFDTGAQPYTSPVGYFAPNNYGLYDMAGNVFEWCWDWYAPPSPAGSPYLGGTDPRGPASSPSGQRVERSGSWYNTADVVRCANRTYGNPNTNATPHLGFRCVIYYAPNFY
jgi:formylglycine-generating enzyme required for sulfatase activity